MEDLNEVMEMTRMDMDDAIDHLTRSLEKIRAGKASPAMLSDVQVVYYGSPTPLQQVANVSTADSRTIAIKPWEKTVLPDIEKAIFAANLGLTPQSDGEVIRINIPPLTEERRRDLAKQARAEGETAKISIRNSRKAANDSIKQLNKDGLSDDQAKGAEDDVQKLTDQYAARIDKLVAAKEADITTI